MVELMSEAAAAAGASNHVHTSILVACCGMVAISFAAAVGAGWAFESWQPEQRWLIESGRVAPWAPSGTTLLQNAGLAGQTLQVQGDRLLAPHPLACDGARHEFVLQPVEGLFEGSLPPPAGRAARALGIGALPVLTWRVTCANAGFDYHLLPGGMALLGLDQVVWRIKRTGSAGTPEVAVVEFLREHMTRDMAFTRSSVAAKKPLLTNGLARAIEEYFTRPAPKDEPPAINGDPFTYSQEYPAGFVIGRVVAAGARATVPVQFMELGGRKKLVELRMRRIEGRWLVDDLLYPDGQTLRGFLKLQPG